MKEVLPIQQLLKDVRQGIGLHERLLSTFKSTVWEDNLNFSKHGAWKE